MLYHHGHLLLLAKNAYDRCLDYPYEASVSIMLSVITLECYVNELQCRIDAFLIHESNDTLKDLSFHLNEYEKNRNSLISKLELILYCLKKEKFDRGSRHFQDIRMLINIRNALVHRKPESTSKLGSNAEESYSLHPFTKFLVDRGLIEKPHEKILPVWSQYLNSPKVAAWAYNTVVDSIISTVSMLPESTTKKIEEFTTKHEKI